ncbi:hypothetical protein Tco_0009035 [Tanacetum coccineum]
MEEVGCLRCLVASEPVVTASFSFSTTLGGGIRVPSYETPRTSLNCLASFLDLEKKIAEVPAADSKGIIERWNSKNCKKYRVGVVPRSHGEDIDEGVLLKNVPDAIIEVSSHVRIDLGGSLSNQSRASPSREIGKKQKLYSKWIRTSDV